MSAVPSQDGRGHELTGVVGLVEQYGLDKRWWYRAVEEKGCPRTRSGANFCSG
jgi:hypothetical protein